MSTNRGDMPASPQSIAATLDGGISLSSEYGYEGMTIRESFAIRMAASLRINDIDWDSKNLAKKAIQDADALLAQLERTK